MTEPQEPQIPAELVKSVMLAAGLTAQMRARRNMIGRFRTGGPRTPYTHAGYTEPDHELDRRMLLDDEDDGSTIGRMASAARRAAR